MKKIAAITMARNDHFFVAKWIRYYGTQLGEENLYVFLDGEDQPIPENAGKANITIRQHISLSRAKGDKARAHFLSGFAQWLMQEKGYDMVIGTDADEFLVVDPDCGKSLAAYLTEIAVPVCVSGLGVDVGHHLHKEKPIQSEIPVLVQRRFAVLSPRYTKPVVISRPVEWGSGFHRVKNNNFRIDKNLYLLHLGYCDSELLRLKSGDADRLSNGWENHLKRRAKTIGMVTRKKAHDGEKLIPVARKIQSVLRPVFAWNKPTMAGWKPVINIPDRFRELI